jgi:K+ transporter
MRSAGRSPGAEALYADMAHCAERKPIAIFWFYLVFPCLHRGWAPIFLSQRKRLMTRELDLD